MIEDKTQIPQHLVADMWLYGLLAAGLALIVVAAIWFRPALDRILRLTRAELLKMRKQIFFIVAMVLLVVGMLGDGLLLVVFMRNETVWRSANAIAIFADVAKVGLYISTIIVLIFGSMLFAGEFDRGTIKILLTRPITRTDLFLAKSIAVAVLALFLVAVVLYVSLAMGCLFGELGPVWDDQSYNSNTSYGRLMEHTIKAIEMSVMAVVAAAFLGIMISNVNESSGFAVAISLTLFLLVDQIMLGAFRDDVRRYFFSQYPSYAFNILRDLSQGSSTKWREAFETGRVYLTVPLGSIAAFMTVGYALFRSRNITA